MVKITNYLNNVNKLFQTGNAREHSYRGFLETLLNEIINDDNIIVTNEPARIRDVGAPDYSITKKDIPIGYIEAKDIDKPLDSKEYKEQFDRYKNALDNLIITDYLNFWFYRHGELVEKIAIAKIEENYIVPIEENFSLFTNSILNFTTFVSQTITSPSKLAKLMAGKARLLQDVIERAIISDIESDENNSLRNEMEVFKANLIHDITPSSFADIYAQTIAYGLFAARLHDETLEDFSRQEATYLIPKSNPFLKGLFNYISGPECDDRLIWIIDSLAEIFLATDVKKLLEGFSQKSGMDDPIIHFYETFLAEYNPKLRKSRGVWYTPEAVVNFIVRACDEVLKDEFCIEDGLTDESKIKIKVDSRSTIFTKKGEKAKNQKVEKEVHKVQILDPATGTGTFLAETIKFIKKDFWGGSWSSYVEEHLIPRLNGFELLMASYAMAHLKLDLLLMETGYKPINPKRFNVFLTNSLEEHHQHSGSLFSTYLANESKEADRVKKETPIIVVMGNPPYSGESSNNNDYINELIDDYKKEWDGSKLKEKNSKWINDDYVKFIRYSESYIEKNNEGILAFITNHSYLDNPTFRGMRYHLLKTFDKIYIVDLHGNSKKKEVSPDGSKDENVFDIMVGVSIIIGIKNKTKSKKLAELFVCDVYGKREFKYTFLNENNIKSLPFRKIEYEKPDFYFFKQNLALKYEYETGFAVSKLFNLYTLGLISKRDKLVIGFSLEEVKEKISYFIDITNNVEEVCNTFNLRTSDNDKWNAKESIESMQDTEIDTYLKNIVYRPLDNRTIFYHEKFVARQNKKIFHHFNYDNNAIIIGRQGESVGGDEWNVIFCTNELVDQNIFRRGGGTIFPIYLYPDENTLETKRIPNLNQEIVSEIEKALNLTFTPEKEEDKNTFAPIDILDYIYAILHTPSYREKYKEFLKIDFPRVHYPNPETFWQLVELGSRLRALHLLEDKSLDERIIDISGEGEMVITNRLNKKDTTITDNQVTLAINENISITNISLIAWEFYIGGYQPAQKWLKDRVGRELSRTDLKHYNKIINALVKTDSIMEEIDELLKV